MSALKAQLTEDMKNAMRSGDTNKRDTVRFLLSEIKNYEIDNGVQDDAGITKVIARELKKMKEANVEFANAGRQDLVDGELPKIEVLESYLPKQMSAEELEAIVAATVAETEDKNFGMVMKAVMAKLQGKTVDGSAVSAAVKKLLA